jgi:hypothetical protein
MNAEQTERIKKLVRMLSSEREGEVVAAAHALVRTLRANGSDIHTLADSIGSGKLSEADMQRLYGAGYDDGKRAAERQQPARFYSVDEPTWHEIAVECAEHRRLRGDREQEFVADMVRRTVHGGIPTEKQAKWLRDIYARIRHG